jgi:hypothetical protein
MPAFLRWSRPGDSWHLSPKSFLPLPKSWRFLHFADFACRISGGGRTYVTEEKVGALPAFQFPGGEIVHPEFLVILALEIKNVLMAGDELMDVSKAVLIEFRKTFPVCEEICEKAASP